MPGAYYSYIILVTFNTGSKLSLAKGPQEILMEPHMAHWLPLPTPELAH